MIENFESEPEMATVDIWEDWRPFLGKLMQFKQAMKVKSKNKIYEQEFIRTHWFERPPDLVFYIDGVEYTISNETKVFFWNAKENMYFMLAGI